MMPLSVQPLGESTPAAGITATGLIFQQADTDDPPKILSGNEVKRVCPAALARWSHLLLVEDDTARAMRLGKPGVESRSNDVLIRLHRIGRSGLMVIDERAYRVGCGEVNDRAAIALDMLDQCATDHAVVVAGTSYGSNRRFLNGLAERNIDAIVEIRPGTRVLGRRDDPGSEISLPSLMDGARWACFRVPVAGSPERKVQYSIARLGAVRLPSGMRGTVFAVETGAIDGVHRGTAFGFTQAEKPRSRALVETIGWTRWIRPLVRRTERAAAALSRGAVPGNGNGRTLNSQINSHPAASIALRLRANIKLSTIHDQQRSEHYSNAADLRGILAPPTRAVTVVELFAGAGGMGLGFLLAQDERSHCRILFSGEVDPIFVNTLNRNHAAARRIFHIDERLAEEKIDPIDLRLPEAIKRAQTAAAEGGGLHVLIGGPPCQGFSNSNRNSWHSANPNNHLVDVYLSYVKALRPRVFLMENVQGISWTANGRVSRNPSSVLEHVRQETAAAGYQVFIQLLDSVWYGVPQYRSRFFVVGLHRDLGYCADDFGAWGPFPHPTHGPGTEAPYVTVRDAIGDLPPVGNGECATGATYSAERSAVAPNDFLRWLRKGTDDGKLTDHVTSKHAEYVIERYRQIPPGGNWESIKHLLTNYADVARTHSNIYRRLDWDHPAVTIGHYRKSMIVHPDQDRGLSLREAARLQSFPDWFRFAGNANGGDGGLVHKQQQLANAVSPKVAQALAQFILRL
jgi:DNA-cytosine methyltransferase